MATKRDIVELLKRDELQAAVELYHLEVRDRRVRGDLIDAIVRSKRARVAEVLAPLSRDRLKEICQGLEMDDGGREKAAIIDRICGDSGASDEVDVAESGSQTSQLLTQVFGDRLVGPAGQETWPFRGVLKVGEHDFDVSIYARVVGGSSRGNPLERRFQNPSQRSPIVDEPDRYELLLGLWIEQGMERAVVVAFDVSRRFERNTRFSLFMPLSLLEQTADTGFATHENGRGELLYAFRPENVGRYVQALVEEGAWKLSHGPTSRAPRAPAQAKQSVEQAVRSDASIYIRPQVGMYAAFARLNYKPWFALAEFLDNSIQSFLHHQAKLVAAGHEGPLVIDVNLDDNEISVTDRAGGIAWTDFPRAFSPASPPDDASGLSEFGLGMKAAACWFARRWSVRTSALGEAVERTVTFDVPTISRDGLENLPIETRPARESDHFTVVTMQDLRVQLRGRTLAKIKDHLRSIYRVLMRDGVVKLRLTVGGNAEELSYQEPALLEAPYYRAKNGPSLLWRKDISVELHDRTITGWVGILRAGSHAKAGFSVFRRRRLIEGTAGEKYKPSLIFGSPNSFASQRITGELFVEGFDVTHTKDGIQWHGYEDDVVDAIRVQCDSPELPLLTQAEGYRVRRTADTLPSYFGIQALETTAFALSSDEAVEMVRAEADVTDQEEVVDNATAPVVPVLQQTTVRLAVKHGAEPWELQLELVRDPAAPFYRISTTATDGGQVVRAQVNLDHEFSVVFINDSEAVLQPILRLVAAHALGEKLARDAAVRNPGFVRLRANEILRGLSSDNAEGSVQ